MARAVGDECDLVGVRMVRGAHLIQERTDGAHQINVLRLVFTANVIGSADLSLLHDGQQRIGMVDPQPAEAPLDEVRQQIQFLDRKDKGFNPENVVKIENAFEIGDYENFKIF